MRGIDFRDISHLMVDAVLMSEFNQPYSEIDNIPTETVIFLLRLAEAKGDYHEAEVKKMKGKNKGRR